MKKLLLLMLVFTSMNAFSHCGTCGEGDASDHSEQEDSSHHQYDDEYREDSAQDSEVEAYDEDAGEVPVEE